MSAYSARYSIEDLRNMVDSNRRHVLGDKMYEAFMDDIINPKKKLASSSSDRDKDVKVERYGSSKWAKGTDATVKSVETKTEADTKEGNNKANVKRS